jgi:hypothetical protein
MRYLACVSIDWHDFPPKGTSGAIVGSLMGIARTVHAIPLAFNVGLNTSIVAFTFFCALAAFSPKLPDLTWAV